METRPLSDKQRNTLTLWAEKTAMGDFYEVHEIFKDRSAQQTMRVLAGLGVVATDSRGRLAGGNPFLQEQPAAAPGPRPGNPAAPIFPQGDDHPAQGAVAPNRPRPAPAPPPPPRPLSPPPPRPRPAPVGGLEEGPGPWAQPPMRNGNGERPEATRIYSYLTKTTWLHLEDALEIGKVRLFGGLYRRGQGASVTAYHYMDLEDLRVLLFDLLHGPAEIEYTEYKGAASGDNGPISRVLKVRRNGDGKTWWRLENGPGQVIGQGAVKPAGEPAAVVNVPMDPHQVKRLALATLAYVDAWQTAELLQAGRDRPGGA